MSRDSNNSHRTSTLAPKLRRSGCALVVALALPLAGCDRGGEAPVAPSTRPSFTAGAGLTAPIIGRGTFSSPFKVKSKNGGWEMEIESDPLDVAMQTITVQPGGHTGWHRHSGPVFVVVTQGVMTFYEPGAAGCAPTVRSAGQGYLDEGEHAHIARNEGQSEVRLAVTYFAPPGAALRIDAPDPGTCTF